MVKVECYSGYRVNERPVAFTINECDYTRSFKIREVIDRWFGETADYFKVIADDENIYLLKYDSRQDIWDLFFYQDPRRIQAIQSPEQKVTVPSRFFPGEGGTRQSFPIH
jgi:hypothetical protein